MIEDKRNPIAHEKKIELHNSETFLEKLKREIWRLHEAQFDGNVDDILDHGLNAAITAWHLHEIVAKEFKLDKKLYRDDVQGRCSDLGLMHDIATQAKHFQITKPQRKNATTNLEMTTTLRPYISKEDWEENKVTMKEWGIPLISSSETYKSLPYHALKVEEREVEEILDEIKFFWKYEIERQKHK